MVMMMVMMTTKLINGMENLHYEERLGRLGLIKHVELEVI